MTDPQIAGLVFGVFGILTLIVIFCWAYSRSGETNDSETENEFRGDRKGECRMPNENTESNFCPNCGVKLEPTSNFCPNCGTPRSVPGNSVIKCPKCGSANIHFITSQGGQRFDKSDACCGYLLCGPLGLLCGVKDQDTKTVRKCMNCNHEF